MLNGKILLIDDDRHRYKFFNTEFGGVEWAKTFKEALELLPKYKWNYVFFDHDLGDPAGDGLDVAKFAIKSKLLKDAKTSIVIHSMNPVGVKNIKDAFTSAGYKDQPISYTSLVKASRDQTKDKEV